MVRWTQLPEPARTQILLKPPTGGSVWPEQQCPVFLMRSVRLCCASGCWYCRYGNFHLRERVALDVGVCCYPHIQIE